MDCHMMVAEPEKVRPRSPLWVSRGSFLTSSTFKWVDDIADAGGSLYCFHLEATCKTRAGRPPPLPTVSAADR